MPKADLNIKGLARNTKLLKSIYDVVWGTFIEKLNAVAVKRGVYVGSGEWPFARTSSQYITLIAVIVVKKYLKLYQLEIPNCPKCKTVLDRDENAGINILKKHYARWVSSCLLLEA